MKVNSNTRDGWIDGGGDKKLGLGRECWRKRMR